MSVEKNGLVSQEETGQVAPIDEVEERVESELKELQEEARKSVAEGLNTGDED